MTLLKLDEVCVPKMPKYNKILHILHKYCKMIYTFTYLQFICQVVQSLVLDIILQRILGTSGAEFWVSEKHLPQEHNYLQ